MVKAKAIKEWSDFFEKAYHYMRRTPNIGCRVFLWDILQWSEIAISSFSLINSSIIKNKLGGRTVEIKVDY